jgi:hypothetical protein
MVSACILEFLYLVPVADLDVVAAKRLGSLAVGDPGKAPVNASRTTHP